MHKIAISITLVMGVIVGSLAPASTALAASTAGFDAGRIIDDSVMADKNSMSVNDIQNFLNSKVPSCDTSGSQNSEMNNSGVPDYNGNGSIQRWEWGKKKYNQTTFPCLKDKTFSGKKAAKVIYDAAQTYSINPKVLLVLLQKEQGLVTDTWPLSIQYRSATGYGCPDGAPCDSQYYGLINQLNKASDLFRTVLDGGWSNYPVGNNSIPWNPNIGACGYSTVNVQNRATSALYRYTPYRPNQAALDAGYGTGNGCSSYGNRNFYLYYTDWFGSTTIPLFKISGGGDTIYLSFGDNFYAAPSYDVFKAWGLVGKSIKLVDPGQLSSYTQGPDLSRVVKFGASAAVYLVDNGKLIFVPDWPTVNSYGLVVGDMKTYSDDNLKTMLGSQGTLTTLARQKSSAIHYVESGNKHLFPDPATFQSLANSLAGTTQSTLISDDLMSTLSAGYPILLDGKVVKAIDSAAIYLYENGELSWFSSETWKAWGRPLDYGYFSNASLSQIPMASSSVPILITDGTNNYLTDSGNKYKFTSSSLSDWGLVGGDFSQLSDGAVSQPPLGVGFKSLLKSGSGAVYMLIGGEKVPVASLEDFSGLGLEWKNVQKFQDSSLALIPTSTSLAFSPNSLVRLPNGGIYWIDKAVAMHSIPSMDIYNAFGFSKYKLRQLDQNNRLDVYNNSALQRIVRNLSGTFYLIDGGKKRFISADAFSSSQYNLSGAQNTILDDSLVSSMVSAPALTQFVQGTGATVYKVINGQKRPLGSPASLFAHGGKWSSVTTVSDEFLSTIPTGTTL